MITYFKKNKAKSLGVLFLIITFGVLVRASKKSDFEYHPPKDFEAKTNFFPDLLPTEFHSLGKKKIDIYIMPELKTAKGSPKTKDGKIHSEFLQGKQEFNFKFGVKDWKLDNYKFQSTPVGEKLELMGSYKGNHGDTKVFIEHYYFSKDKRARSIHLIYPQSAEKRAIEEAKNSLHNFKPEFE